MGKKFRFKKKALPKKTEADIHAKGQYFTTNSTLQEKIFEFILNDPSTILEPSFGQGDLVKYVSDKNNSVVFDMYEIDESIKLLDGIGDNNLEYCDFLSKNINKKYKTIIGNPPYVKTRTGNLYIDFIRKCVNLLQENGELIFIIPSDFFKLTSAKNVLIDMMKDGTFTHIFHPHNENLFKGAAIDIIIFRYCKNKSLDKKLLYNNVEKFIINSDGLVTFSNIQQTNMTKMEDIFNIYVGLVSAKESVYKNDKFGNIMVLNGKETFTKYIYINKFPTKNKELNEYLKSYKSILMSRKIRKFNANNWFEWGAPRNIKIMENNKDKPCIYMHTMTRSNKVAFKSKVNYFGGGILMLKPKININLDKIVVYLNSIEFRKNFIYSGRFKIGHRQISKSYIDNSWKLG